MISSYRFASARKASLSINLEVGTTNPLVDNVKHRLLLDSSGHDEGEDSEHSQTSVKGLSLLSESELKGRQVTKWLAVAGSGAFV